MTLTRDESRERNTAAERRKREQRAAAGQCRTCGAPLAVMDPVSGKLTCSAMCGSPSVAIMYASCVFCRRPYAARMVGKGKLCPDPECRRKMAQIGRDQRKPAMSQWGKDRRAARLAEGLCPQCGEPLEELGGKMICSVPCREHLRATLIAYATCLFCREMFISRSRGKVSSLCRKRECQRAMGGVRNKRHTPSETARERAKAATRAHNHARRAGVSDITPEQEMAMRKKAKNCPLCGVRMTDQPYLPSSKHLDHIVPINQGGTHTHGNTRIICCSCNVRRPHDGSDYDGQLTLWAQSPGVQERAPRKGGFRNTTTCRKGLHPWPESAVVLWGHKQCGPCVEASRGEGYISRIGTRRKGVRGADARLEMGRRIQEMRKQGMPFRAIARELGYSDSRSVRDLLAMVVTAGDESADQANYPKQSA